MTVAASIRQISTAPDQMVSSWDNPRLSSWMHRIFWVLGISLGLVEAMATRFTMNVDGIMYLDLGNAYFNHNWNAAVNGYLSPLYPWLLGAAIRLFRAPMYWESTVVHFLNWIVFLVSMGAFELLILEVCRSNRIASGEDDLIRPLPEWVLQALGYSLFLYAGLVWISAEIVTPDQCVAAVMYLVAALLLKLQGKNAGWRWHAILGILLGVGYLVKAILLPVGLVILITTPFLGTRERFWRGFARAGLTAFLFAAVAAPLIIALSLSKGRLTSGETGKIAYAQMVDGLVNYRYWQGEGNLGTPKHPSRKLWSNPDVYEFATPVGGTYPLWYDTSYWFDGVKARFDVAGQLRVLKGTLRLLADCLLEQAALLVVLVSLIFVDFGAYSYGRQVASAWAVWIPAVVGIGLYTLIWFEPRYVGGFLTIIGLTWFGAIRLFPSENEWFLIIKYKRLAAFSSTLGYTSFPPKV